MIKHKEDFSVAFRNKISDLKELYGSMPLVDVKKIRPIMAQMMTFLGQHSVFKDSILEVLAHELDSLTESNDIRLSRAVIQMIEYIMQKYRWDEVKLMLIESFKKSENPSIRLEIELVIRRVYERDWPDGDFDVYELEDSIWDL
ncbi:MAG: hypothetical protein ACPGN3_16120 [Opitutales bacterium]